MKAFKQFFSVLLLVIFTVIITFNLDSCKEGTLAYKSNLDKIEKNEFYLNKLFDVKIFEENQTINSIKVSINDKEIKGTSIKLDSTIVNYGRNFLNVSINYADNKVLTIDRIFTVYSSTPEVKSTYKILQETVHDGAIFTQGFEEENGIIFESAGQKGESRVIKHILGSKKPIQEHLNENDVFGEGLTILNGKVYQLTWQNKKALIYNASDLKLEKELSYPTELKEGWGICNDGTNFFATGDSTAGCLYNLTPDFKLIKILPIVGNKKIYYQANELEFANGKIYANIWKENIIIVINPKTGQVTNYYDLSEIASKNQTDQENVLNGIAHLSGNTFLITGKNWTKTYKVELN